MGSSLTGITALCPWARHINPSLVLVQPRKTRPFIAERLLMGRKESNQTKKNMHLQWIMVKNNILSTVLPHFGCSLFQSVSWVSPIESFLFETWNCVVNFKQEPSLWKKSYSHLKCPHYLMWRFYQHFIIFFVTFRDCGHINKINTIKSKTHQESTCNCMQAADYDSSSKLIYWKLQPLLKLEDV